MKNRKWLFLLMTLAAVLIILPGMAVKAVAADTLGVKIVDGETDEFPKHGSVTLPDYQHLTYGAEYAYAVDKGDVVKVDIIPDEGYYTASVSVTYTSNTTGNPVSLNFDESTSSFTVPEGRNVKEPITIYVTFSKSEPSHSIRTLISTDDETGNTVSVDKDTAEAGETVTVTLGMAPGTELSVLQLWKVDGNTLSDVELTQVDSTHYTFLMPDYDVRVFAMFILNSYSVTVEDTPSMAETGCTVVADKTEAHYGDAVTITVTMEDHTQMDGELAVTYEADGQTHNVELESLGNGQYRFSMPAHNVTVSAAFSFNYEGYYVDREWKLASGEAMEHNKAFLELAVDGVSIHKNGYYVPAGQRVDVVTNSNQGYDEIYGGYGIVDIRYSWEENGQIRSESINDLQFDQLMDGTGWFIMPDGPVTLTVVEAPTYQVVVASSNGRGQVTANTGNAAVGSTIKAAVGSTVTVTGTVTNETFSNLIWTCSNAITDLSAPEGQPNVRTFTMPAQNVQVTVEFTMQPLSFISRSWDDTKKELTEKTETINYYTRLVSRASETYILDEETYGGYYFVEGTVELGSNVILQTAGDIKLILGVNSMLKANGGIYITENSTLNIYGQDSDIYPQEDGKIEARGSNNAGIGGRHNTAAGDLIIHDGYIDAYGAGGSAGIGGIRSITINGGWIEAHGGSSSAGIGKGKNDTCESITINGGHVEATGGTDGAGIGGSSGSGSGYITINSGVVKATGGRNGAGLGGGKERGQGKPITINGGYVEATGGAGAAGIGGGWCGSNDSTTYINGGEVIATAGSGGAGIGAGSNFKTGGEIIITGGIVKAYGNTGGAGIGSGDDGYGVRVTISGGYVRAVAGGGAAGIGTGCYAHSTPVITITGGTVEAFGFRTNTYPSRARTKQTGHTGDGAGIGGGRNGDGGTVTISGGCVLAKGGSYSAGIGGGGPEGRKPHGDGANVTISGGTVIAMNGKEGVGQAIGSVDGNDCGILSISEGLLVRSSTGDDKGVYSFEQALMAMGNLPLASAANRGSKARDDIVLIMSCADHAGSYTITSETHTLQCIVCGLKITENHTYDDDDHVCTACGYQNQICNVSFAANGGGGTMTAMTVVPGRDFYLPSCAFTSPSEDMVFGGWLVGSDTTVKPVGEKITVNGDVTLKAAWYYVIRFDDSENGYLTADSSAAAAGSTVTLTPQPEEGYGAASVTVRCGVTVIPCTAEADGTYSFTMPDGPVDVTVVFEAVTPVFAKESVLLTGRIGLTFFMELPQIEGVDYGASYMEFDINNRTERVDFDPDFKDPETNSLYGFTCPLSCLEMGEPITAVFHYGEDGTVTEIPSLELCISYYSGLYDEANTSVDAETIAFLRAMADYGHYTQIHLSERDGWTIGEEYMSIDRYYTLSYDYDAVLEALKDSGLVLVNNGSEIESVSCELVQGTDTSILVYLQPVSGYTGTVTATVNGAVTEAVRQVDGRYLVTIPELPAQKLGTVFTVAAKTSSGSATVNLSALSYAYQVLSTSDNEDAKNAAAALYYYAGTALPTAEIVPAFTSHQLILSGQIGMHFYMNIPEGMTDGTMEFTVGDRTATAEGALQNGERYKFTCYVNSVEMGETITAAYTWTAGGETKSVTNATSVKKYLETIIACENYDGEDALKLKYKAAAPLAKAIYNYGYYAMQAVPGGSKHPEMSDEYIENLVTSLEGYAITAALDKNVITNASYSLDLDSETAINFYLTTESELTKDNVTVTAPSGTSFAYTVERVGSRYRVRITGIGAHELGTEFTLTTGNTTISASAMTYVQQCLNNPNAVDEAKHAAAALYGYYQKAISYIRPEET